MTLHRRQGRYGSALAIVAGILAISALAGASPSIQVEAEDYASYNDLGGMLIQSVPCAGTSGYEVADGIDVAGEWIALSVDIPASGCYRVVGGFQSKTGYSVEIRLQVVGSRVDPVDFGFTGEGLG